MFGTFPCFITSGCTVAEYAVSAFVQILIEPAVVLACAIVQAIVTVTIACCFYIDFLDIFVVE